MPTILIEGPELRIVPWNPALPSCRCWSTFSASVIPRIGGRAWGVLLLAVIWPGVVVDPHVDPHVGPRQAVSGPLISATPSDVEVPDSATRITGPQDQRQQDQRQQAAGKQAAGQQDQRVEATGRQDDKPLEDAQLFYNPKYDDSALPVRREEEWTPPPPIDWTMEGPLELTFDHLKFHIQPDQAFEVRQLTLDLLKLRGRTIKIRGFVRPSFKEKNITRFVFVRDNQECCFGPGALLYDCMIVNMAEGHSVNFSTRPITIEGRFALKPFRGPDKRVWAIFELNETILR